MRNREQKISYHKIVIIVIPIIIAILYLNTLNVPFYMDDIPHIKDNIIIHIKSLSIGEFKKVIFNNYFLRRPITNISFALNYYFGGLDLSGYHIVNIVIHIITAITIYLFLDTILSSYELRVMSYELKDRPRTLTFPSRGKGKGWIALIATLLWATSPVQTQAVTYIVQRATSMATMFYMLSLLCYVKGREKKIEYSRQNTVDRKTFKSFCPVFCILYSVSCLFALLAFGTKEISATLPLVIILYEIYLFSRFDPRAIRKISVYLMIVFISSIIVGLIYINIGSQGGIIEGIKRVISVRLLQHSFTPLQRLLTEFRVVIYYMSLLLLPLPSRLRLIYDFSVSHSLFDPVSTSLCMLIILGMIGYGIYISRRRPVISFFILWFFINLAIESTVIRLWLVFEHRLYLPSIGFFVIVAIGIEELRVKSKEWKVRKGRGRSSILSPYTCLLFSLYCLLLIQSVWTIQRNYVWKDAFTFWSDNLKKEPYSGTVHNNLGHYYYKNGEIDKAIKEYKDALRSDPYHPEVHYNLGLAYKDHGDISTAIERYKDAIRYSSDFPDAHYNLGIIYYEQGRIELALREFTEATRGDPYLSKAHYNIGVIYYDQGRPELAIKKYKEVLEIETYYPEALYNIAYALEEIDKRDEAIGYYERFLKVAVKDKTYNEFIEKAQEHLKRLKGM